MWRGSFVSEWHLAEGQFTCEKHKHADKQKLRWPYTVEWPRLRLLGEGEVLDRAVQRMGVVAADFRDHPEDNDSVRARRLMGKLGVGEQRARAVVRDWRNARKLDG